MLKASVDNIQKDYDFYFSKNTTYGLGGKAACAYYPEGPWQAAECFTYLKNRNEKIFILGKGSDVLAADTGFEGSVICTKNMKLIGHNGDILHCEAGVTVSEMLSYCIKNSLSGLEFLAGIPATIGGLAFMNGGIASQKIGNNIITVTVFDDKFRNLSRSQCNFSNKHSTMRDIDCIITDVYLKVNVSDGQTVKQNVEKYLSFRSCQPAGKTCGCVFKNPEGMSAGAIIDECGLKGLSYGNASVSREHANFIINNGTCAKDVYSLIQKVKEQVFLQKNILLEEEVVYIGDFLNVTDG